MERREWIKLPISNTRNLSRSLCKVRIETTVVKILGPNKRFKVAEIVPLLVSGKSSLNNSLNLVK